MLKVSQQFGIRRVGYPLLKKNQTISCYYIISSYIKMGKTLNKIKYLIIFLKMGFLDWLKYHSFLPLFYQKSQIYKTESSPLKIWREYLLMASETKRFNTCMTKLDLSNLYIREKLSQQLPFINCQRTLCGNWLLGIRDHMSGFSLVRSIKPMNIRHETGNSQ